MNKKVITIAILTLSALIVLTLFSFGPLSNIRKKSGINPASLNPAQQPSAGVSDTKAYNNVDVKENYYGISFPKDWQIGTGNAPGSYTINFSGGNGEIRLMDVPDNTTLELYVLSQEEPRIKKTSSAYQRVDYQKMTVSGNEAHELVYANGENQNKTKTITVYIAGQDHAGVVSLSAPFDAFANVLPSFEKIINSFNWQNK